MKKIIIPALVMMLLVSSVFAAVNEDGTIVYPEKAKEDVDKEVTLKESSYISFLINKIVNLQALYPSKGSYKQDETVTLQSEFDTWNVRCDSVRVIFEVYKPSGSLLTAPSQSWSSQTGTQYINARWDSTFSFVELGTYNAVVYAVCQDYFSTFTDNNPEYDVNQYPLISTPSVSKTSFEIVTKDEEECQVTDEQDYTRCYNDNIYWYNNCGGLAALKEGCIYGCKDDSTCKPAPTEETTITCYKCIGETLDTTSVTAIDPQCPEGYSSVKPTCEGAVGASDIRIIPESVTRSVPDLANNIHPMPGKEVVVKFKVENKGDQLGVINVQAAIYPDWYAGRADVGLMAFVFEQIPNPIENQPYVSSGKILLDAGETSDVITLRPKVPFEGNLLEEKSAVDDSYTLIIGLYTQVGQQYQNHAGLTGSQNNIIFSRNLDTCHKFIAVDESYYCGGDVTKAIRVECTSAGKIEWISPDPCPAETIKRSALTIDELKKSTEADRIASMCTRNADCENSNCLSLKYLGDKYGYTEDPNFLERVKGSLESEEKFSTAWRIALDAAFPGLALGTTYNSYQGIKGFFDAKKTDDIGYCIDEEKFDFGEWFEENTILAIGIGVMIFIVLIVALSPKKGGP